MPVTHLCLARLDLEHGLDGQKRAFAVRSSVCELLETMYFPSDGLALKQQLGLWCGRCHTRWHEYPTLCVPLPELISLHPEITYGPLLFKYLCFAPALFLVPYSDFTLVPLFTMLRLLQSPDAVTSAYLLSSQNRVIHTGPHQRYLAQDSLNVL